MGGGGGEGERNARIERLKSEEHVSGKYQEKQMSTDEETTEIQSKPEKRGGSQAYRGNG